jgi:hypothetical protein
MISNTDSILFVYSTEHIRVKVYSSRAQATVSVGVWGCTVVTQPVHHRRQRIGLRAIASFASLAAVPYQPCPLQHREVLGNSRLGHDGQIRDELGLSQPAGHA